MMAGKSTRLETEDSSFDEISPPVRETKTSKGAIADSWEDEDDSASETDLPAFDSHADTTSQSHTPSHKEVIPLQKPNGESLTGIAPPPNTPRSNTPRRTAPSSKEAVPLFGPTGEPLSGVTSPRSSRFGTPGQRPEKTASTASRMIAGALGQRASKRTDEQRAYDEAAREKLRKAKEEEVRREIESKKARESVWDG